MRILSIFCGLSFAVMAGYFLAFATLSMLATAPMPATDSLPLDRSFGPICWVALGLALLSGGLACLSRCEGWAALAIGCGIFVLCHLAMLAGLGGTGVPALLCLIAAGFALVPLVHTPSSYWRVEG